jgi:hypothetical protein
MHGRGNEEYQAPAVAALHFLALCANRLGWRELGVFSKPVLELGAILGAARE